MPQCFWSIENPSGPSYQVGMYHGDKSGHLLLYSGKHILRIAFMVDKPLSHSFYLGETLYEFQLVSQKKAWDYRLREKVTGKIIFPSNSYPAESDIISDKWIAGLLLLLAILFFVVCFLVLR